MPLIETFRYISVFYLLITDCTCFSCCFIGVLFGFFKCFLEVDVQGTIKVKAFLSSYLSLMLRSRNISDLCSQFIAITLHSQEALVQSEWKDYSDLQQLFPFWFRIQKLISHFTFLSCFLDFHFHHSGNSISCKKTGFGIQLHLVELSW